MIKFKGQIFKKIMKCSADFTNFPVFYSPLLNHNSFNNNKAKNNHSSLPNHNANTANNSKSAPLSSFIKSNTPTYNFSISDVEKPRSFYLHDEPFYQQKSTKDFEEYYSKILCVADLLLYPELSISKGEFITQNATKLSHFPNVPSIPVDEDDRIHCICHKKDNLPMAMCSICNCWSHLQCLSISEDKIPDIFVCLYCQHSLVSGIKKQIIDLIDPIKADISNHLKVLIPIESQANKCTNDSMIQINGIPELKRIIEAMNQYVTQSRKIWTNICDVRNSFERIMRGFVWEKAQEDMETYDEASDVPEDQNSDKEKNNDE